MLKIMCVPLAGLMFTLLAVSVSWCESPREYRFQKVDERTIAFELGELAAGTVFMGTFPTWVDRVQLSGTWKNTTGSEVVIKEVIESCSCFDIELARRAVRPGDSVAFDGAFDVSRAGYGGMGFTLQFEDLRVPPQEMQLEFYRPKLPTPRPARMTFGRSATSGVTRRFVIEAVLDPEQDTFQLAGEIKSSDPRVSCRLVDLNSMKVRRPDTMRVSLRHVATFEATFNSTDETTAPLEGEIHLPLQVGAANEIVRVPFDGQTELAIEPKPDRLVIIATEQMPVRIIERKILLQLSDELIAQAGQIQVSSSDARIDATWKASEDSKSRSSEIDLKIDVRESGSFAGDVTVTCGEHTLVIPVKVRKFGQVASGP